MLGAVLSLVQLQYKPAAVEEFNRGVSMVDFNPVSGGICLVLALVPSCMSFNVWGEVIGGSGGD